MNAKMILAGAAALSLAFAASANAKVFDFSFTGEGVSGFGTLTTGAAGSPFTVTGATGEITDTQGALSGSPFSINGISGYAGADNLLFVPPTASAGFVDFGGVSFTTTAGVDFNLGGGGDEGLGTVLNDSVNNPVGYPVPQFGSNDVTLSVAVPEPATWAMMLVGFGGMGAAMRSRRKAAVVAA